VTVGGDHRIIEVVGPAGAGKSTIATEMITVAGVRVVCSMTDAMPVGRRVTSMLRATPRVVRLAVTGSLSTRQIAWVGRLHAYESLLAHPSEGILVLDQGPIYTLSRLIAARPASAGDGWYASRIEACAHRLDAVVVLDARDEVLIERIRSRDKTHTVKYSTESEAASAIDSQRGEIERVVSAAAAHGLTVLTFDTATRTAADIAREALAGTVSRIDTEAGKTMGHR
jgi:hypothetical protein